jgi:predicted phosphodiesterase
MRIGLICDIHEDFQALKEALRQFERRNCDELVCLGDIVGYDVSSHGRGQPRNPSACIAAIKANCRYAVIGNHDLFALRKTPQPTHAFAFPENWYELSMHERRLLSDNRVWLYETESTTTRLNRSERNYLDTLPEHLVLSCSNRCVHISHALHPDLTGSLLLRPHNPWELREHMQILRHHGCSYGFSGHSHPSGILIARDQDICGASFGRLALDEDLTQYSCPAIADVGSKPGYTIVDFAEMTIGTFKLSNGTSRWDTWYERLFKKS